MLELLTQLSAAELPLRYVATETTHEIEMYRALCGVCTDQGFAPEVEHPYENILLTHGSLGSSIGPAAWIRLRDEDEERLLVMIGYDQINGGCVLVACVDDMDWLNLMVLLYRPPTQN